MGKPLNAALDHTKRDKQERWSHRVYTPDWLVRPINYGQKQVRSIKIHRDGRFPYASIRFTHGSWSGIGSRTHGELIWDVKETIERETGMAWRKGPR
jgi:hypothetical protein